MIILDIRLINLYFLFGLFEFGLDRKITYHSASSGDFLMPTVRNWLITPVLKIRCFGIMCSRSLFVHLLGLPFTALCRLLLMFTISALVLGPARYYILAIVF